MSATVLTCFADCGIVNATAQTNIAAGEGQNFTVNFATPFPSAPTVVVTPYMTESAPAWVGQMSVGVVGKTSTGFTVRVINNSDATHHLGAFYWIAILPSHA